MKLKKILCLVASIAIAVQGIIIPISAKAAVKEVETTVLSWDTAKNPDSWTNDSESQSSLTYDETNGLVFKKSAETQRDIWSIPLETEEQSGALKASYEFMFPSKVSGVDNKLGSYYTYIMNLYYNGTTAVTDKTALRLQDLYCFKLDPDNGPEDYGAGNITDKWYEIEYIIDYDNDSFKTILYDGGNAVKTVEKTNVGITDKYASKFEMLLMSQDNSENASVYVKNVNVSRITEVEVPVEGEVKLLAWDTAKNPESWIAGSDNVGTITYDETNGLKFEKTASGTGIWNIPLETEEQSGVLKASYKFMFPSYISEGVENKLGSYYTYIMDLYYNGSTAVTDKTALRLQDLWCFKLNPDNGEDYGAGNITDKWYEIEYIIDYDNDSFKIILYDGGNAVKTVEKTNVGITNKYAGKLEMIIRSNGSDNAAVYVKDINITRYNMAVSETNITDNFDISNPITITFGKDVDASKLASAISITDASGEAVSFTVTAEGNTATVDAELSENAQYTISIAKGADVGEAMVSAFTKTFTTGYKTASFEPAVNLASDTWQIRGNETLWGSDFITLTKNGTETYYAVDQKAFVKAKNEAMANNGLYDSDGDGIADKRIGYSNAADYSDTGYAYALIMLPVTETAPTDDDLVISMKVKGVNAKNMFLNYMAESEDGINGKEVMKSYIFAEPFSTTYEYGQMDTEFNVSENAWHDISYIITPAKGEETINYIKGVTVDGVYTPLNNPAIPTGALTDASGALTLRVSTDETVDKTEIYVKDVEVIRAAALEAGSNDRELSSSDNIMTVLFSSPAISAEDIKSNAKVYSGENIVSGAIGGVTLSEDKMSANITLNISSSGNYTLSLDGMKDIYQVVASGTQIPFSFTYESLVEYVGVDAYTDGTFYPIISVKKDTGVECAFIIAAYDGENMLLETEAIEITAIPDEYGEFTIDVPIELSPYNSANTYKFMCWDSVENMLPYFATEDIKNFVD